MQFFGQNKNSVFVWLDSIGHSERMQNIDTKGLVSKSKVRFSSMEVKPLIPCFVFTPRHICSGDAVAYENGASRTNFPSLPGEMQASIQKCDKERSKP